MQNGHSFKLQQRQAIVEALVCNMAECKLNSNDLLRETLPLSRN